MIQIIKHRATTPMANNKVKIPTDRPIPMPNRETRRIPTDRPIPMPNKAPRRIPMANRKGKIPMDRPIQTFKVTYSLVA